MSMFPTKRQQAAALAMMDNKDTYGGKSLPDVTCDPRYYESFQGAPGDFCALDPDDVKWNVALEIAEQMFPTGLILFDVDGTLVEPVIGEKFRKTADDWRWIKRIADRRAHLLALKSDGVAVAIVTNQGGVAFGILAEADIDQAIHATAQEAEVEHVYICYWHPKGKIAQYTGESDMRKPNPGMLLQACKDTDTDPFDALMVGDMKDDQEAAANAGIAFAWAETYFDGTPHSEVA